MRLWAVIELAHRARQLESPSLDLPPRRLVDVLSDWWKLRLKPRLVGVATHLRERRRTM